jgi:hypothetical protein
MKELPTQPTNIIKDEDKPLSAESPQVCWESTSQTTLLALSIGRLTFHMPTYSCTDWYNSQMVTHSKGPKMCWLYVWSNDQATLEDERNSKQKQDPSSNLSRWLRLHALTSWNLWHKDS